MNKHVSSRAYPGKVHPPKIYYYEYRGRYNKQA